jgi:phytoene dehydrogenase-like protein
VMATRSEGTDVVVVGGGMAGLIAACYLGRAGADVTVLEKSSRLGGRAATRAVDGFQFNVGIHALYTGGATSRVLEELGISYAYGVPTDTFVLRDGSIAAFPADPVGLLRSDVFGARAKLAFVRFAATLIRTDASAVRHTSVRAWLHEKVRNPDVRRLLTAFACTLVYSTALDLVSAEVFVDKFQRSLKHPVHYIDGGWQVLVDALRDVAEAHGVRILRSTGAEAVMLEDDRATGVRLRDGRVVQASAVLLAMGPREAAKLLDTAGDAVLRRMVDRLLPARLACLDVALERLPNPDHPIVQDLDAPRFMSAQSVYARVAPGGAALIASFKQLDPREHTDPHADERDLESLLDATQPGWRDLVVTRRFLPSIEAVGALPTAKDGGFASRPASQVPGVAGLYLAGDWVGSEGFLVDASTASAVAATRLITDGPLARDRRSADRLVSDGAA